MTNERLEQIRRYIDEGIHNDDDVRELLEEAVEARADANFYHSLYDATRHRLDRMSVENDRLASEVALRVEGCP